MKIRVFKREDGSVVYNSISPKYEGGHFVPDLSKPIFEEVDDRTQPIFSEALPEVIVGYAKKQVLVGHQKRELTLEDCRIPKALEGLPFVVMDESDLVESDSRTGNYHEMIYFDGECLKQNLKQDKAWQACLMPTFLIKQKQQEKLKKDLDLILDHDIVDAIEVARLQRGLQKVEDLHPIKDEAKLYEIALDGLERAEIEKPVIRQKLKQKINALKES